VTAGISLEMSMAATRTYIRKFAAHLAGTVRRFRSCNWEQANILRDPGTERGKGNAFMKDMLLN
jgi:hypothetical protein